MNRLATVLGQGLSSATNLLLQLALAYTLSAQAFGALVAVLSLYYLGLAVVRASVGDVLVSGLHEPWGRSRTLALRVGTIGAAAGGAAAIINGYEQLSISILACGMPVMMVNDALRYRAWAVGRPVVVIAMDSLWFGVMGAGTGIGLALHGPVWVLIGAWVSGAAISAVIGGMALRDAEEGPSSSARELSMARRGLIADQVPQAVVGQVLPILVVAVAGAELAGVHRAALLPFMVAETVLVALRVDLMSTVREAAEIGGNAGLGALQESTSTMIRVSVLTCAFALAVYWEPMRALLGDSGEKVGPWFVAAAGLVVVRAGGRPSADLIALKRGHRGTMVVRTVSVVAEVGVGLVGGLVYGLGGLLTGRLIVVACTAVGWSLVARSDLGVSSEPLERPCP